MDIVTVATNFGIVGVMALACGYYIVTRDRQRDTEQERQEQRHAAERKEFNEVVQRQHSEMREQAFRASEALNNNTQVLTEIRTIIRGKRQ